MSKGVPILAGERARLLAQRLPSGVVRLAVVVAVLVPVGASIAASAAGTPVTVARATSLGWLAAAVAVSLAISALGLVFVDATAGVVLAAITTAAAGLLPEGNGGAPGAWLAAAALLGVLAVADVFLGARRRALAHVTWRADAHGAAAAPPLPAHLRDGLLSVGRWRVALGVVLVLAGVGLAAWGVRDAGQAAAFRARATPVDGTVEAVAEDTTSMTVAGADGRAYEVPVTAQVRTVGDSVQVRVDPASGRVEAVDDVYDPTLIAVPTAAALVLGLGLIGNVRRLRRRLEHLLTEPQPAVQALATMAPRARGAVLVAYDDVSQVAAVARDLVLVLEPHSSAEWLAAEQPAAVHDPTHLDARSPERGHPDDDELVPVADLSDDELLDIAEVLGDPDLDPDAEYDRGGGTDLDDVAQAFGPGPAWHLTPVEVIGPLEDGWPVVLRDGGRAYVSVAGLRFPRWRAVRPRRGPAAEPRPVWGALTGATSDAIVRLGVATGRWLPWVALPVVWLASAWVVRVTGPTLRLVLPGLVVVGVGWSLSQAGLSTLELRPGALQFRGLIVDTLVPWARITAVVTRERALVVRYDDAAGVGRALLLADSNAGRPLTRDRARAGEVAARIERARALGGDGAGRACRRPSASTLVAVCWAVAVFGPAALA